MNHKIIPLTYLINFYDLNIIIFQESNTVPTSNAKKLYDKGLMQRKVALYLSEIINFDEV